MTTTGAPSTLETEVIDAPSSSWGSRLLRSLLPVIAAIILGAIVLAAIGRNPFEFYFNIINQGLLSPSGRQESLIRMAPLLLIAAGLMIAFPAGIWNLGIDGQLIVSAVVVAALGPELADHVSGWVLLPLLCLVGFLIGALWSVIPALMKAWLGMNEIITTLMTTFLGLRFASLLVKEFFNDTSTTVPQTKVLAVDDRLPSIAGSRVHIGVILGVVAVIIVHLVMNRTDFGLRLRVVGMNPHAAVHAGMNMKQLTMAIFLLSSGFAGLAGAVEIIGVHGVVRADWNPAFGFVVIPLVFLARFHAAGVIPFIAGFAVLSIGGESASRKAGLPNYFVLLLVALMLLFLAVSEFWDARNRERTGHG